MTNSIISLDSFIQFNIVMTLGYLAARCISRFHLSQKQKLIFSRFSFLIIASAFFLVPFLISVLSIPDSSFKLEPIWRIAADTINPPNMGTDLIVERGESTSFPISLYSIITFFVILSMVWGVCRYFRNVMILNKIKNNSLYVRRLKNINILINNTIDIPFCWSGVRNHYVILPHHLLENTDEMKLTIQHELQHIRQGDTRWLHFFTFMKSICCLNPFLKNWTSWIEELQEFACDEAVVMRRNTSVQLYAECLVNIAKKSLRQPELPEVALGIHHLTKTILYRRVNMIFNYKKIKTATLSILVSYVFIFFAGISAAYAFNNNSLSQLNKDQIEQIIQDSKLDSQFHIIATPEVVAEINHIRHSDQARDYMRQSLERMKKYENIIHVQLKKNAMPRDLLAVPLVESGYQPLEASKNPLQAAGVWQIVPTTAQRFGLILNAHRDDRFDTRLATDAALSYLTTNYKQFNDWKLAVIAYEIGENNTEQLIKKTGSKDAWILARSKSAPESLIKFVAMFDAAVIIMHNPSLIN